MIACYMHRLWHVHFLQPMSYTGWHTDIVHVPLKCNDYTEFNLTAMGDKETDELILKLTQKSKEYWQAENFSMIIYITQSVALRNVWVRRISSYSFGTIKCTRGRSIRWLPELGVWSLDFFLQNFWSLPYLIHNNSL